MKLLYPIFVMLIKQGVNVYVITRDPKEHNISLAMQSEDEIRRFEELGVQVFLCKGYHHRKLAMIDRKLLWEGSLNILSQSKSREIMRRVVNEVLTLEVFNFLKYKKLLQ